MRLLALAAIVILASQARAGEDLNVLKPAPRKMLYAYLEGEAQKHFDARRQTVAALKTPDDVRRRQQELRTRFIDALGGLPEKTPLNARTVGRLKGDGFHVEKVIYESRPAHHVTAALYLPEGKGPFPGVLVPCGHSANGKEAEAYQRACILMARNGLAVLCYDPIGQGERSQILDRTGKPALAGSTTEHTMVGVGALLVGRCTATYRIWDGIRSLDYLASRPEVDPKRLGCTGNSGGGTLTAYLMALDERIVAAAPSCYITSLERLFATIGPQDAEQNIPGQVAFGMEHADYVAMRAPRPTLICTGTQDYFDIKGAWTTFREASLLYGVLGHGERVAMFEYNDKHGFSKPRREAAVRWMRRWLLKADDAPVEGEFPIFKSLQCTRSGQVLEDFKGVSVTQLNIQEAERLAKGRAEALAKRPREETLKEVRRLIGLGEPVPAARAKVVGGVERDGYRLMKVLYETDPGIQLPGLSFSAAKLKDRQPLILYLHSGGKAVDAAPGGPIEKLVKAGRWVLALDLRGWGETSPAAPAKGRPSPFGTDSREAFLGMHLNRPLLGQRVRDVLAVVNSLKLFQEFEVIAIEAAGPVALHAAVLDERIKAVTLERSVVSWANVVATPISHNQLTNVVPGVLRSYDLPELAGLIAPRPLTIRSAVDATGQPLPPDDVKKAYAPCRAAYERAKASEAFAVEAVKGKPAEKEARYRLATFSAEVTPPLGHPLMGGGIAPAQRVEDPLYAHGFVLLGAGQPVVVTAVDWCEIRNDAYDRWRAALAEAAGTTPGRVLVSCLHQHDAPIADLQAQRLLEKAGAAGKICDLEFHERAVQRVAAALKASLGKARRVTHFGIGQAKVEQVASNRRYLLPDGKPAFNRMSATRDPKIRSQPEGTIDPWLKTLSFWDGETPVLALSAYATHPMSYYGKGGVSSDFVGLARKRRQAEEPGVMQMYVSGCSGNVTAGKYNDGSADNRPVLTERIYRALKEAWQTTKRHPLEEVTYRAAPLRLEPRDGAGFTVEGLRKRLESDKRSFGQCLAALGLSWRQRADAGHKFTVPVLDLGKAVYVLMPAEAYVEYQLLAQKLRPESFVVVAGYGECAPGYIPIERAWKEGDGNLSDWCWVAPGAEQAMTTALEGALRVENQK
ncbi:MAG: S9 family peptidase [Gemmataceae bacterium]|nr:S9 family peptidase [Gemmataceae bacterium]